MVDTRKSKALRTCLATSSQRTTTKRSKKFNNPVNDTGSESGEREISTCQNTHINPQDEGLVTPTPAGFACSLFYPQDEGLVTPTPAGEVVAEPKFPWAKLLSKYSENPHCVIRSAVFTVGQQRCDLLIRDLFMSIVLCELTQMKHGGPSVATLKIKGSGVTPVEVNGKTYQKGTHVHLQGGDEVVFSTPWKHAYIFQPLKYENLSAPDRASSATIFEAQSAPLQGLHVETRAGDSSSVHESSRRQAHKDFLRAGVLNPQDIEFSLEKFPYFLSFRDEL